MSKWNHSMCTDCWINSNPGRQPVVVNIRSVEICCFCGRKTTSGIYVRYDPVALRCKGVHGWMKESKKTLKIQKSSSENF